MCTLATPNPGPAACGYKTHNSIIFGWPLAAPPQLNCDEGNL